MKMFRQLFLAIVTVLLAATVTCAQNMTYRFVEVEQNPFSTEQPNDPSALYECKLAVVGWNGNQSFGIPYKDVKQLMAYFGVNKPEELAEKTFESSKTDGPAAINYLVVLQKHGGFYTPPSDAELFERTAQAMSKMKCPDFSDVDEDTVYNAFRKFWEGFIVDHDWLYNLNKRIVELSKGKVKLVKGNPEDFPVHVKGPAEYLLLKKGKETIKIIIGPYNKPVGFY